MPDWDALPRSTMTRPEGEPANDRTQVSFDRPDERVLNYPRLFPMLRRNDEVDIDEQMYFVRSCALSVERSGALTLHVRLSPSVLDRGFGA